MTCSYNKHLCKIEINSILIHKKFAEKTSDQVIGKTFSLVAKNQYDINMALEDLFPKTGNTMHKA